MAKPVKKRDFNRHADRFYDYLIAHRGEVLRYVTVALITGILQFIAKRLLIGAVSLGEMLPFLLRHVIMFIALKYWVYKEGGTGAFYTGRQVMIAVMAVVMGTYVFNYVTIWLVAWLERVLLVNYIVQAVLEIFYFLVYQFFVFKEPKSN